MRKYLFLGLSLLIISMALPVEAESPSRQIINLTNKLRAEHNLTRLSSNSKLEEAAQAKAEAIFENQSFQHNLPESNFYEFVDRTGYRYDSLGENLAIDLDDPKIIVEKWMNSPLHRDNLLDPRHQEIGVAMKTATVNGITTTVTVQLMAKPELFNLTTPAISLIGVFIITIALLKLAEYGNKIYNK